MNHTTIELESDYKVKDVSIQTQSPVFGVCVSCSKSELQRSSSHQYSQLEEPTCLDWNKGTSQKNQRKRHYSYSILIPVALKAFKGWKVIPEDEPY